MSNKKTYKYMSGHGHSNRPITLTNEYRCRTTGFLEMGNAIF